MPSETPTSHVAPPQRLWRLPSWLLTHVASRSYRLVIDWLGSASARTNYAVLAGLEEFGPVSQAALGRRLGIDRSDIVALLNDLEHEGLVSRSSDESDRRRNAVKITPAGSHALCGLDDLLSGAQDALLEPLSATERRQFSELLKRLLEYHTVFRGPNDREP